MASHHRNRSPRDYDRYHDDDDDHNGRSRKRRHTHGLDEDLLESRREERCRISQMGVPGVWGHSPKEPIY